MIKNVLGCLLAFALALPLTPVALADDTVVKIGTEADYPPFEFTDSAGAFQGFEVDLLNRICETQHLSCVFVNGNFDSLIADLYAHKIDVIASQMSITERRQKLVDFTGVVTAAQVAWIARRSSGISGQPESFKGLVIGVKNDALYANYIKGALQGPLTITAYSAMDAAYDDLTKGKIDAIFGDKYMQWDWLRKGGQDKGFQFIGKPIYDAATFGVGTAFAVRKGEPDLLKALNDGLTKANRDGTFKYLNDKYFPFSVGVPAK